MIIVIASFSILQGFVSLASASDASASSIVYVNSTVKSDFNDGSINHPYPTIDEAINSVNPGGIVIIADGTYTGTENTNLTINKNITIIGQNQNKTIINGTDVNMIFKIIGEANVTIQDIIITNSTSSAIFNDKSNLNTINCTFTGNTAGSGGAIYNNQGNLNAVNCNFKYNKASNKGGAIYNHYGTINSLSGCTFVDNVVITPSYRYGDGGAISNQEGNIHSIEDCNFTDNAANANGGAIYNTNVINIIHCTFTGNTADNGGAIKNYGKLLTLEDCTFINNTANNGGAIDNPNIIILSSSTFTGNTANNGGGILNSAFISLNDCNFTGNTANNGGAIDNPNGIMKPINGCNFMDNTADNGGAIYNPRGIIESISDCTFTGNKVSSKGGAIYNQYFIPSLSGCTFTGNKANSNGGAISNIGTITSKECNFNSNSADNGGAIYNEEGSTIVHYSSFVNNTANKGNAIARNSGPVDAEYNWWNSNTNPQSINNLIIGKVDADSWLVLSINSVNDTINVGSNSSVTVDLFHDSGILNDPTHPKLYYHDPKGGHVPDGIIVSLTGIHGNLNPNRLTLVNGHATSTFTATDAGTSVIHALINNQLISTKNITVNKLPVTITVNNVNGANGKKVSLTAKLTDEKGNPLTDKKITFSVNGKNISSTITNSNGIATTTYKLTKAGKFTVTATLTDSIYANTTGNAILTVEPAANLYISTILNNKHPKTNEIFLLAYKLINKGPNTAKNVKITFQIPEGLKFGFIKLDPYKWSYNKKTRTLTWILDSVPIGNHQIYLKIKSATPGIYKITSNIKSDTFNLNSTNSTVTINIHSKK